MQEEIRIKVKGESTHSMEQPNLVVKQVERGNVYGTKLSEKNSKVLCSDFYFVHERLTSQVPDSHFAFYVVSITITAQKRGKWE